MQWNFRRSNISQKTTMTGVQRAIDVGQNTWGEIARLTELNASNAVNSTTTPECAWVQIAKRRKEKNPVTETTRKKILRVDHDTQDRRRLINKFDTYSEKIPKRDQQKHTAVQKAIPSNYTARERLPYKRQETQMQNLDKRNKNRSWTGYSYGYKRHGRTSVQLVDTHNTWNRVTGHPDQVENTHQRSSSHGGMQRHPGKSNTENTGEDCSHSRETLYPYLEDKHWKICRWSNLMRREHWRNQSRPSTKYKPEMKTWIGFCVNIKGDLKALAKQNAKEKTPTSICRLRMMHSQLHRNHGEYHTIWWNP